MVFKWTLVVFEVAQGRVRARPVASGGEREGRLAVTQGLAGGETLVAHPPDSMKDGDQVKVKG